MTTDTPTSNDLLSLLRFRVLDYRNATEEACLRLMLEAADEIERLRAKFQSTALSLNSESVIKSSADDSSAVP